jgi:hypothetical protein
MNPINDDSYQDILVPKYNLHKEVEKHPSNNEETGTVSVKDFGVVTDSGVSSYSTSSPDVRSGAKDLMTDINSFVNLLLRGEEKPIFECLKKIKSDGVSIEEFFANVVLELDSAYRARLEGENNRHNIVLSQVVSHWSNVKMEEIMNTLLSVTSHNYLDQNLGTKIAIVRMLRLK